MRKKTTIIILLLHFVTLNIIGQNTELYINFEHYFNEKKIILDSSYTNALNQKFTLTKFKYYISNIQLTTSQGKNTLIKQSFLINEDDSLSKQIHLTKIPKNEYSAISFIIGVDSLHNCNGAQSGALDPVNAMFWAWNTGYIFLKLEGKAAASNSPGHIFEYHIGGYKQPTNCIREVHLRLKPTIKNQLNIRVNINEILQTPTTIDFSKLSSVTDFNNATMVADNYTDMFSIIE